MENKAQPDDEVLMSLVEQALAQPVDQRRAYLERACAGNSELFEQAWKYVRWDERMQGFLIEPLFRPPNPDTHQSLGTLLMTPAQSTSGAEQPFESGQRLDNRFRIVRELARGGMGIVYEAMDEKLDRRIAIKCARKGFRKRLPPEVRNAREISHPNVCKIFEFHTADTHQGPIDFITMEFLEGETLAESLRRGRLPEAEARAIALQLCAGLGEAHRNRVVHGDLKSNNIILTPTADGTVRAVITDFGLARGLGSASKTTQSGEAGGTPDYMAPELWRGEKASPASDVYALGVILYELAAGRRPYTPEVPWQDRLIRNLAPVDRKWDRILTRCLDPEPARRCQTGGEVMQAFAPSRSRLWFMAAAAAILLVMVSTLVTLQRAKPPRQMVRLAVLPFESSQDIAPLAAHLSLDAAVQIARLKSSSQTSLAVIPRSEISNKNVDTLEKARALGATHALHGTLEKQNQDFTLHAYFTDARSGGNAKEWQIRYKASELRYAPVALAGMVTNALRLPSSIANATVNAAARQDYLTGLSYVHGDTHVDDAIRLLERAVAANPDSPLTYAGLAEAQWLKYFFTRETVWRERAQESVRQAELRNPDLPEVHLVSGLIKADSSFLELAEADYQRAIELQPNNGDAYRRLSGIYNRNHQPNEALAAIQKAVQLQPGYFKNHQQLGTLYILRGDYRDAVPEFQKMVDLAPHLAQSHSALGAALGYLGRLPEAENELRAAVHLEDSSHNEETLGAILMDLGKPGEAISCFLQALAVGPGSADLWLDLGLSYGRESRESDAKAAFRSGLAATEKDLIEDPRDQGARARLAYFAARLGELQRAKFEIAQTLQVSGDDSDVCLMAVLTYEELGRREQTLALLTRLPAVLGQLNRYPELADLRRDPRFLQLLSSNHVQQ